MEKSSVIDKYWKFDTQRYIRDYMENLKTIQTLQVVLETYESSTREDGSISFRTTVQIRMLREKIKDLEAYTAGFEAIWSQLDESEQAIIYVMYFEEHESKEAAIASLCKEYGFSRSTAYHLLEKALDAIQIGALTQNTHIINKYWSFRKEAFLKDYLWNMNKLDEKRDKLMELEEISVPAQRTDKVNVQTSMNACTHLDDMIRKENLESDIDAYEAYEQIYSAVWKTLSDQERDFITTFYYDDYPNKQSAEIALSEKYAYSTSAIYAMRKAIINKICRRLNG